MAAELRVDGDAVEFEVDHAGVVGRWDVRLNGSELVVRWVADCESSAIAVKPDCSNKVQLVAVSP